MTNKQITIKEVKNYIAFKNVELMGMLTHHFFSATVIQEFDGFKVGDEIPHLIHEAGINRFVVY